MKSNILRALYLDFFKSKQHKIVSSAPMVVKSDPTLMFTNAGMNQFKDIFLGDSNPKDLRVANSQKCLRVSGKHNDLEEVGHDTYHHTMFEMLGSWSFGDYFKEDAINWAWEFLTEVCKLDKNRLYVTVFEGAKEDDLEKDNEAFNFWRKYLPDDRILNGNKKDNFWEMGETGPCGPCSEIHFDNRTDEERAKVSGADLVNEDHPQVIEIWNLVFMQYNRFADGNLKTLPNSHVDTGMGFERLAMIMQGVKSNYDTDIFQPIIQTIAKKANLEYGKNEEQDIAMRVIADHIRAISFSIADGQLPSNVKAGYVIRRILRRAVRYAYTFLNLKTSFMHELVDVLADQLGEQFTELEAQKDLIQKVVKEEEESFLRTLEDGLKRIEQLVKKSADTVSGKEVFELYDTYGFPADLTALILSEQNLSFSQADFDAAMQEQKDRSKQAGKVEKGDWEVLIQDETEEFVGYNNLETEVKITRYRKVKTKDGEQFQIVFNLTPFYPEGGGQVGDTGMIENENESITVVDTKKENKLIVHFTNELPKDVNASFTAKVNANDRKASARNHTATHLLHESLRTILGDHVAQKGSLVNPNYLRFDFTHFSKIEKTDLQKIEADVNAKILANIILDEHNNLPLSKAEDLGAIMLFGEKYEDVVRMIQFNSSKELCGGTHVKATGEIGLFKILSEGSTSSGIRRIEATTGANALNYLNDKEALLNEIAGLVKNKDLKKGVEQLIATNKTLEKQINTLKKANAGNIKEDLLKSAIVVNGIRFIAQEVEMDAEDMKNVSFSLRKEENLAMVLAAKVGEKALLTVMLTDDVVAKGFNAGAMIREIATEIYGGGGGQAFFATAGGANPNGIAAALEKSKKIIF
ncbi:MAG: alanine--tRNA ligase [Flavobacteriales bacterium]|nr:alanine--tRNA ligase [Flavobacteriales bacterium]